MFTSKTPNTSHSAIGDTWTWLSRRSIGGKLAVGALVFGAATGSWGTAVMGGFVGFAMIHRKGLGKMLKGAGTVMSFGTGGAEERTQTRGLLQGFTSSGKLADLRQKIVEGQAYSQRLAGRITNNEKLYALSKSKLESDVEAFRLRRAAFGAMAQTNTVSYKDERKWVAEEPAAIAKLEGALAKLEKTLDADRDERDKVNANLENWKAREKNLAADVDREALEKDLFEASRAHA